MQDPMLEAHVANIKGEINTTQIQKIKKEQKMLAAQQAQLQKTCDALEALDPSHGYMSAEGASGCESVAGSGTSVAPQANLGDSLKDVVLRQLSSYIQTWRRMKNIIILFTFFSINNKSS